MMIKSNVSNLAGIIQDFVKTEQEKYSKLGYTHPPTLGDLYEALTEHIALKMLPLSSFDLKIVSGFISNDFGFLSREIDRMLVVGEGKKIGLTDSYEYHVKDVLVIFEVKKTLNKNDLNDAHELVSEINKAYSNYFESFLENGGNIDIKRPAKLYAKVTGKVEPTDYSDIHTMTKEDAMIFYTLVRDYFSPIAIIHGYGGYKTEEGLRKAFLDFILTKVDNGSFGTSRIPNLTSSGNFSIIKTTGMPYVHPKISDDYWPIVTSNRGNVIKLMIEIIWTKISSRFDVSMPWGHDLDSEIMPILLLGKYKCDDKTGKEGWMYETCELSEKELRKVDREGVWDPAILTKDLYILAQYICIVGGLNPSSNEFRDYAQVHSQSIEDVTSLLINTYHFALDRYGDVIPIGSNLHAVEIDDNSWALSDDRVRLTQWCEKQSIEPIFVNFAILKS